MSNIIPPLISTSPPPIHVNNIDDNEEDDAEEDNINEEDDDDDDFGNFTSASIDCSYDGLSLPTTPQDTPTRSKSMTDFNYNENNEPIEENQYNPDEKLQDLQQMETESIKLDLVNDSNQLDIEQKGIDLNESLDKDYQDKRKDLDELQSNFMIDAESNSKMVDESNLKTVDESNLKIEDESNLKIEAETNVKIDVLEELNDDLNESSLGVKSNAGTLDCIREIDVYIEEPPELNCLTDTVEGFIDDDDSGEGFGINDDFQPFSDRFLNDNHLNIGDYNASKFNEPVDDDPIPAYDESEHDFCANFDEESIDVAETVKIKEDVQTIPSLNETKERDLHSIETNVIGDINSINSLDLLKTSSEVNDEVLRCDVEEIDGDFGDFANFPATKTNQDLTTSWNLTNVNDVDGIIEERLLDEEQDDFDDFNDFNDYQTPETKADRLFDASLNGNIQKVQELMEELYPSPGTSTGELSEESNDRPQLNLIGDRIFDQLKDITETVAINYAWNKSASQSALLKSLNIDMRNILHGLGWNLAVPKFAATLSNAPLEPIKSDCASTSIPIQQRQLPKEIIDKGKETETLENGALTTTSDPNNIPRAQFDWSSAGLTNPLSTFSQSNSMTLLLDMDCLVASLDITNTNDIKTPETNATKTEITPETNENDLDNVWNCWLHCDSSNTSPISGLNEKMVDVDSVKSLQFINEQTKNDLTEDDETNVTETLQQIEDDFGVFQSSVHQETILRESHITNAGKTTIDSSNFASDETYESNTNVTSVLNLDGSEDDDFADFQMSLPQLNEEQPQRHVTLHTTAILKPTVLLLPNVEQINLKNNSQINWPDPGLNEEDLRNIELSFCNLKTINSTKNDVEINKNHVKVTKIDEKINQNDLEVTKINQEVKLQAKEKIDVEVVRIDCKEHAREEWEVKLTGVIDEQSNNVEKEKGKDGVKADKNIGGGGDEEDDWSEFVSNKNVLTSSTSALKEFQQQQEVQRRISTPELQQLSVPQLNNLQPPKQPIPVITPHGLLQTKIPSNTGSYLSNMQTSYVNNYGQATSGTIFSCNPTQSTTAYNKQSNNTNFITNLNSPTNLQQTSTYNQPTLSYNQTTPCYNQLTSSYNQQMSNCNRQTSVYCEKSNNSEPMSNHVQYLSNNSCYLLNSKPLSLGNVTNSTHKMSKFRNITGGETLSASNLVSNNFATITQQYQQQSNKTSTTTSGTLLANKQNVYNEDDWTDFISSPPTTQQQQHGNTLQSKTSFVSTAVAGVSSSTTRQVNHQQNSGCVGSLSAFGTNRQTNIIQNPINYDEANYYYYYNNRTNNDKGANSNFNNTLQNKVPDLEFAMAPKAKMKQ